MTAQCGVRAGQRSVVFVETRDKMKADEGVFATNQRSGVGAL